MKQRGRKNSGGRSRRWTCIFQIWGDAEKFVVFNLNFWV